jgi:hypothetical protein
MNALIAAAAECPPESPPWVYILVAFLVGMCVAFVLGGRS